MAILRQQIFTLTCSRAEKGTPASLQELSALMDFFGDGELKELEELIVAFMGEKPHLANILIEIEDTHPRESYS
jgi:hypothetical protein